MTCQSPQHSPCGHPTGWLTFPFFLPLSRAWFAYKTAPNSLSGHSIAVQSASKKRPQSNFSPFLLSAGELTSDVTPVVGVPMTMLDALSLDLPLLRDGSLGRAADDHPCAGSVEAGPVELQALEATVRAGTNDCWS